MINKLLLFLMVIGLFSCSSPKYITKSQSEIPVWNLDDTGVNYILLSDNDLIKSHILCTSYQLIKDKKYSKLDNYLDSLEQSGVHSSDLYLSRTLLLITKKDYLTALLSLKNINDQDYVLLKRLLSIDLAYEKARINKETDYLILLKDYQALIDAYPDDRTLKKIVSIRLRFLRYNY